MRGFAKVSYALHQEIRCFPKSDGNVLNEFVRMHTYAHDMLWSVDGNPPEFVIIDIEDEKFIAASANKIRRTT